MWQLETNHWQRNVVSSLIFVGETSNVQSNPVGERLFRTQCLLGCASTASCRRESPAKYGCNKALLSMGPASNKKQAWSVSFRNVVSKSCFCLGSYWSPTVPASEKSHAETWWLSNCFGHEISWFQNCGTRQPPKYQRTVPLHFKIEDFMRFKRSSSIPDIPHIIFRPKTYRVSILISFIWDVPTGSNGFHFLHHFVTFHHLSKDLVFRNQLQVKVGWIFSSHLKLQVLANLWSLWNPLYKGDELCSKNSELYSGKILLMKESNLISSKNPLFPIGLVRSKGALRDFWSINRALCKMDFLFKYVFPKWWNSSSPC